MENPVSWRGTYICINLETLFMDLLKLLKMKVSSKHKRIFAMG